MPDVLQTAARPLKLWVVMNRALWAMEDRLRRQTESHGLSLTEFAVLEVLLHKGDLPLGEIGERVLRTSGSMTYVLDKLQKRGLIVRRACEADRRVLYGALTDEGRAVIQKVFDEHALLIDDLAGVLTDAEQDQLIDMMKRIGLASRNR
jgi:MarR family transcriptional regulator, 2-MHQ and catechol-resistance regulon repressor